MTDINALRTEIFTNGLGSAYQPAYLGMTQPQLLAALQALTVSVNIDVAVSAVVGMLILKQVYLTLQAFSQGATTGVTTHDNALAAAKNLFSLITIPNAPAFGTSIPANYTTIKGMLDAILAQETATPGSTGVTQTIHDALLALCVVTQAKYPGVSSNDVWVALGKP